MKFWVVQLWWIWGESVWWFRLKINCDLLSVITCETFGKDLPIPNIWSTNLLLKNIFQKFMTFVSMRVTRTRTRTNNVTRTAHCLAALFSKTRNNYRHYLTKVIHKKFHPVAILTNLTTYGLKRVFFLKSPDQMRHN